MERADDFRQIEAAGRCFASALTQKDRKAMAALLRAAARYVEGDDGQAGHLAVFAIPEFRR